MLRFKIGNVFVSLFGLLIITVSGFSGPINQNLLNSLENLTSLIQLTNVPLDMLEPSDTLFIAWNPPAENGILWYGFNPGNGDTNNYPNRYQPPNSIPGQLLFSAGLLPIGMLYAMVSTPSGNTSVEFIIIRESPDAVIMIYPQSDVDSIPGVPTATPVFSWEANPGVPYYHLVLSDQPFEVETQPDGSVLTTGANVIWQVITSNTSIEYATADPSNYFSSAMVPPLVGDLNGQTRPTYNWVVLNNYGNQPGFSSDVVSDLMGFEVYVEPPFDPPVLLTPGNEEIISSEVILFQWAADPAAISYYFYLCKLETSPDSSTVYVPIFVTQTTDNHLEFFAQDLLTSGSYRWKVIAMDDQGEGNMSVPFDFFYDVDAATVEFYVYDEVFNQPIQGVEINFIPLEGANISFVATDESGWAWKDIPFGIYKIQLSKPGYTTVIAETLSVLNTIVPEQDLYIHPASVYVSGTVVDNSLQLISYADVIATNVYNFQTLNTSTNNNGYFSISLDAGVWSFRAEKIGFTTSPLITISIVDSLYNLDEHGGPLRISSNLYTLDGYVLNPGGEPISLATVTCSNGVEEYDCITSDDGYYAINVAPGTWSLTASKPVFWVSASIPAIQVINSGSSNNLELTPSANVVSGMVYEGAILSAGDALVQAVPSAGPITEAYVSEQGNYILSLTSGNYQINAFRTGFTSPPPIYLTLNIGETISGLNIVLAPNPSYINGKVTSDGLQPVPSATVTSGAVTTTTNTQGNYTLNVPAGPSTVTATKSGYISASSPQLNVGVGQTLNNIDLIIPPNAATINGTVLSNSQPVYLAQVSARKVSTGTIYTTQTLTTGAYTFNLSYGSYWVKASKTGLVPAAPESILVNLNPGQTVNNINLSLIPNTGTISGTVYCNGVGLYNCQVNMTALDAPTLTFSTQSSFYGGFNLSVTAGHIYSVQASKTGYSPASINSSLVTVNSIQNLTLNLSQLQSQISGKVYALPGNTYIEGANVLATLQGGGQFSAQSNSVGNYTVNLNAGSYSITASKAGYLSASRDTSIASGQSIANFHFYLQPNFAGLQGFIRKASDQSPISNAMVSIIEVNTLSGNSTYSDTSGFYAFNQLAQGSYNITVSHPQYQSAYLNGVVLLGGSSVSQNFSLNANFAGLIGTVEDTLDSPIGDAMVVAELESGTIYSTQSSSSGNYQFQNLASGNYLVSASRDGYSVDTSSIQLSVSVLDTINFTLIRNDGKIIGKVIDQLGNAVNGVQVTGEDTLTNVANAITAPNGIFTLEDLCNLSPYTLQFVKTGYSIYPPGTVVQALPSPAPTDTITISMHQNTLTISGRVTNQNLTPKVGIEVRAAVGSSFLSDETDASGQYLITSVAPQTTYLLYTYSYEFELDDTSMTVAVGQSPLSNIDLMVMEHSASISGNVGLPNIQVKAQKSNGQILSAVSYLDGSYVVPYLFDGQYEVYPSALGHTSSPATRTVNLNFAQQASGIDFTLSFNTIDISGYVYETFDSSALAGAPVVAWSSASLDTVFSSDDGSFIFTGLTPSINYEISTNLPDSVYDDDHYNLTAGSSSISGIELYPAVHNSSINGWITDLEGNAVTGVSVDLVGVDTVTTTDSSFSFVQLYPSAVYNLNLYASGFADTAYSCALAPAQTLNLGALHLRSLSGAVYGTLTNASTGLNLKNVLVTIANQSNTFEQWIITTANGLYQFENLPSDNYQLTVARKGFTTLQSGYFYFDNSENRLQNFSLNPLPNSIYGILMAESGLGLPGTAYADKFGQGLFTDQADSIGNYSIILTPGNYQLHADCDTLDSFFDNMTLVSGGSICFNLTLLNTGKIVTLITVSGLEPLWCAQSTLQNQSNFNLFTNTNSPYDSTIYFSGLRPNPFTALAEMAGFQALDSPRLIYPTLGQIDTVQFIMLPTENAVSGLVMDVVNSEPLAQAEVFLYRSGDLDTLTAISNDAGDFEFLNLPDGQYSLWAQRNGCLLTDSSSSSFSLQNQIPVSEALWLQSISQAISGSATDVLFNLPLGGKSIHLAGAGKDTSALTNINGSYLFTDLGDGLYALKVDSPGNYTVQPDSHQVSIIASAPVLGVDFYFTPQIEYYDISGSVKHGSENLANAQVIVMSTLVGSKRDTAYTNSSGNYHFYNWEAPDEVMVKVQKSGYPALTSQSFLLEADTSVNFLYPHGQLKFFASFDGDSALSGINVNIYSPAVNIDTLLFTNSLGWAQTNDLLPGNNLNKIPYFITITSFIPGLLPLQTFIDSLSQDTTLTDTLILGINYSAPDSSNINLPVEVLANIPEALVAGSSGNYPLSLFYSPVGSNSFQEIFMSPVPISPPDGTGDEQEVVPLSSSFSNPGKGSPNSYNSNTNINFASIPGNFNQTEILSPPGMLTYSANIPPQSSSGKVRFYIRAGSGNRIYTNQSQPDSITISALGQLAYLQISPVNSEAQWLTNQSFTLSAFDDAYNLINDQLDSINWSHWSANNPADSLGTLILDSTNFSAQFWCADTGVEIIEVRAFKDYNSIIAQTDLNIVNNQVGSLSLTPNITGYTISNTDTVIFTVNACDPEGKVISITPQWSPIPENLGNLIPFGGNKAKFIPAPGLIGQVSISVSDSLSGVSASFNADNQDPSERGLFVGQSVTNTTEVTIHDTSGMQLFIPAGAVSAGSQALITLKRPPLPQIKKNTPEFEIHMDSYNLSTSAPFSPQIQSGEIGMFLTLPVPEETRRLRLALGHWNEEQAEWDTSSGILSPGKTAISDSIYSFSEFAVIGVSKPLGLENLEFHPNPFSPYHPSGKNLQIEFILNSQLSSTPVVSIKVFNLRGDLVRTLINNEQMEKGPHYYINGVFQDGVPDGSVEWDGFTDNNLMARNGRYVVQIKVKDPSGEKTRVGTIVLIK